MTQQDLEKLKELGLKNPLVEDAYNELMGIYADATKTFYKELNQTVFALSTELKHIRNGNKEAAPIIGGDDKTFERVFKLASDGDKIFGSLRKGKEDIDPESAKKAKEEEANSEGSFVDRSANRKRNS